MSARKHILGVVLAGGNSRRFGREKAFGDLGGESIIAHVIALFKPQVGRLIINANGDPARFEGFGLPIEADRDHPGLGPLSGLLAAFDWAAQHAPGATAIATVSSDVPFLPADLVERLVQEGSGGAAIAKSGNRRHPTIAVWPIAVRDAVEDALSQQSLSIDGFARSLDAIAVEFPMREVGGEALDPFFNINTPDDLAAARRLFSGTER
jgi:molybdopterin-guanine dinucleotide biosynthesis protein A